MQQVELIGLTIDLFQQKHLRRRKVSKVWIEPKRFRPDSLELSGGD